MDNKEESLRLLKEAEEDLERAKRYIELKDWVTVIHYAQLAIEKSAKAVISCFEAYEWTHDPSGQLNKLIEKGYLDEDFKKVASHVKEAAPWHGRSMYGGLRGGAWRSPSELCTENDARRLLQKAVECMGKAKEFTGKFW